MMVTTFRVDNNLMKQFEITTRRSTSMTDPKTVLVIVAFALSFATGIPALVLGRSVLIGWLLLVAILVPMLFLSLMLRKDRNVIAQGYNLEAWTDDRWLVYAASQNTLSPTYANPDMEDPRHVRDVYLVSLSPATTSLSYDAAARMIHLTGEIYHRQIQDFDKDGYGTLSPSAMRYVGAVSIPDVFVPNLREKLQSTYGLAS